MPVPPARPGQPPDFSYLQLSPAGELARPEIGASWRELGNLSTGLVRVLDDSHHAVGSWHPHLDPHELQVGLRHMLLTRLAGETVTTPVRDVGFTVVERAST